MPPTKPFTIKIQPSLRNSRRIASKNWRPSRPKRTELSSSSLPKMESFSSKSSSDGESSVPEPIGEKLDCSMCEDKFYDPSYLNWHVMIEHGEEVLETLQVQQRKSNFFRSPAKRIGIVRPSSASATLTSGETKRRESRRKLFRSDLPTKKDGQEPSGSNKMTSNSSRKFTCTRCAKVLTTAWSLTRHMKLHQSKAFCCNTCNFRTFNSKIMKEHVESRHREVPTIIKETPSKKSLTKNLNKKARGNRSSAAYGCPSCYATFASDAGIKYHVKVRHANENVELKCKHCGFTTEDLLEFVNHRFSHNEEKIFKCDFCRQKFISRSRKLSHEKLHGTDAKFEKCPFCKVVFFGHGRLKKHILQDHFST